MVSLAAIEPRRFNEKDSDRHRVDKKAACIGEQIFSGSVEDTENKRGEQSALQATKPSDRDHDQEQHEVENGKARREPEQLDGKAAAERGKPGPHREGEREQPVDINTDRLRHPAVVDSRADSGADIRALERIPE